VLKPITTAKKEAIALLQAGIINDSTYGVLTGVIIGYIDEVSS